MTPNEALAAIINEWPHSVVAPKICDAYRVLRSHIEATTPWLPPQQEGFGPWIEYWPCDPGPRVNDEVFVLAEIDRKKKYTPQVRGLARNVVWENTGRSAIVAYCVKLPDADGKAAERKNALENRCGND